MSTDTYRHGGRDPHDVLGVPRGADRQQVIRAFHRKARSGGHPDTGGDARTFEEIVRARDVLLKQRRPTAYHPHQRTAKASARPSAVPPRPPYSPPKKTSRLAVATAVLALLGPVFWPLAIIVGHLAMRHINRTGQGGGALVPVALLFLYVLTIPLLLRILSLVLIP